MEKSLRPLQKIIKSTGALGYPLLFFCLAFWSSCNTCTSLTDENELSSGLGDDVSVTAAGFLTVHNWIRTQTFWPVIDRSGHFVFSHRAPSSCSVMEEKTGQGWATPKSRAWMALSHSWSGPPYWVNIASLSLDKASGWVWRQKGQEFLPIFTSWVSLWEYGNLRFRRRKFPSQQWRITSLLVIGKQGSEGIFSQLFLPPTWLSWREPSVVAAYDFVNFINPHPLPNSPPCGLQIVP